MQIEWRSIGGEGGREIGAVDMRDISRRGLIFLVFDSGANFAPDRPRCVIRSQRHSACLEIGLQTDYRRGAQLSVIRCLV